MRRYLIVGMLIVIVVIIAASLIYIDQESKRAADEIRIPYEQTKQSMATQDQRRTACRDLQGTPSAYDVCLANR